MFAGTGGSGVKDMPSSHSQVMSRKCVECHIYRAEAQDNKGNSEPKGGHTFRVDGGVCLKCHENPETLVKNWQEKTLPMIKQLKDLLDNTDNKYTRTYKDARANYFIVTSDGGSGLHNPRYAQALLQYSISSMLTETVWKK